MQEFFEHHDALRVGLAVLLAFGLCFGVVLLVSGHRLPTGTAVSYVADRESEVAHIAMSGAMLLMLVVSASHRLWFTVFAILTALYGCILVVRLRQCRTARFSAERTAAATYHPLAAAAMVYTT
ncbi:DUF5134 domain-containing protein [Skermania sp. ID1734]|nr:DUF5134 domain-containing protein [Skermania sp. ID1734]